MDGVMFHPQAAAEVQISSLWQRIYIPVDRNCEIALFRADGTCLVRNYCLHEEQLNALVLYPKQPHLLGRFVCATFKFGWAAARALLQRRADS